MDKWLTCCLGLFHYTGLIYQLILWEKGGLGGDTVGRKEQVDSSVQIVEEHGKGSRLTLCDHKGQTYTSPQSFIHKFGIEKYLQIECFGKFGKSDC